MGARAEVVVGDRQDARAEPDDRRRRPRRRDDHVVPGVAGGEADLQDRAHRQVGDDEACAGGARVRGEAFDDADGEVDGVATAPDRGHVGHAVAPRDRNDQRSDRFQVGQKVDARVTQFDRKSGKVQLSIKALEVAEEKEAMQQYGSSDSGASLGDILGAAIRNRNASAQKDDDKDEDKDDE